MKLKIADEYMYVYLILGGPSAVVPTRVCRIILAAFINQYKRNGGKKFKRLYFKDLQKNTQSMLLRNEMRSLDFFSC